MTNNLTETENYERTFYEIPLNYGDLAVGIDNRAKQELMTAVMDSLTSMETINQTEKALRRWRKAARSLETIAAYAAGREY